MPEIDKILEDMRKLAESSEGKEMIEAVERLAVKIDIAARVMKQLPEIVEILKSDQAAVLEMLGDELSVMPFSEVA